MDPYTARAVTAQRWWWGGVNAITLILHYLLERLKYDPNNLSLTMCWKVINVFLFSRWAQQLKSIFLQVRLKEKWGEIVFNISIISSQYMTPVGGGRRCLKWAETVADRDFGCTNADDKTICNGCLEDAFTAAFISDFTCCVWRKSLFNRWAAPAAIINNRVFETIGSFCRAFNPNTD